MTTPELDELCINTLRFLAVDAVQKANSGHPGAPMGAATIAYVVWDRFLKHNPDDSKWPDRDRFILSKGHACPVWYAALAERGYFDKTHLATLRRLNSILQGHPDMHKTPGIDMTAGSLGQGLGAGLGMALSAKLRGRDYHTWVVIGDGEGRQKICSEHLDMPINDI